MLQGGKFLTTDNDQALRNCLFQHGDLARMIEAVLHDPMEQVVEVVLATGTDIVQALVLKPLNRLGKPVAGLEEATLRALPCRRVVIGHGSPVFFRAVKLGKRHTLNASSVAFMRLRSEAALAASWPEPVVSDTQPKKKGAGTRRL